MILSRRDFLLTSAAVLSFTPRAPLRILILGGTGFVGPHIIHAALTRGHTVAMLNRGQRQPSQNTGDFARVESVMGDRTQPTAYDRVRNRTWDAVIDTAQNITWTREAAQALAPSSKYFLYVSSTGVFFPYRTVDIPEDGPVRLVDEPPQDPPSYGVMKALSENEARRAFGNNAIIVRPNYIVGPGDPTDRWTYWPVRIARGGEVMVPGRKTDFVQYTDVRDLAEWMIALLERGTTGTFNATGPYPKQTLEQFVTGLAPLARTPVTFTWIEDYDWLRAYPLRRRADGTTSGLTAAVPWIMPQGNSLGHVRIDNRKAVAAGLEFRPLLTTARDTVEWRESDAVPADIKATPRYVLTQEQEQAMLTAWKSRHDES